MPWIAGKLDEVALVADDGSGRDGTLYSQMAEMKTRMQPSKPRDGQTRNACFQVRIHENDMAHVIMCKLHIWY